MVDGVLPRCRTTPAARLCLPIAAMGTYRLGSGGAVVDVLLDGFVHGLRRQEYGYVYAEGAGGADVQRDAVAVASSGRSAVM